MTPPPARDRGTPSSAHSINPLPPPDNPNMWKPSPATSPVIRGAYLAPYNLPKPPPIVIPPQTLIISLPRTLENLRAASGSGGAAAAAAVERRPVPPGGLSLQMLMGYSEDEVEPELRALGIHVGHMSLWKKKAIANHYYQIGTSQRMGPSTADTDKARRKAAEAKADKAKARRAAATVAAAKSSR